MARWVNIKDNKQKIGQYRLLQCKDVDLRPILHWLADNQEHWCMLWEMPWPYRGEDTDNLRQAIVRKLIDRGLSGGCGCGCRADLCITDKGLALINRPRTHAYNGY